MIKLLLTIPLALTPLFCYSCNNKDICYSCNNKDIGKEVGSRINEENQKLIEELNEIIIKQRKEIELLKKRYYEEYLEEEIKKIEDTKTYKLLDEILKEMQRKTKDYNEIHKKLVKLEDTKIMEKMRE